MEVGDENTWFTECLRSFSRFSFVCDKSKTDIFALVNENELITVNFSPKINLFMCGHPSNE